MDEEEAILSGLMEWVNEILPDCSCHVEETNGNKTLRVGPEYASAAITESGIVMNGKLIGWSRADIQREFQRLVLISVSKRDPCIMLNNPKFAEAWAHIMTQDVSRD